jgi:Uma2 family endonuclease
MSVAPLGSAGVRFEDLHEQLWPREEIFDGSLHVTPFPGVTHQRVVGKLNAALLRAAPKELEVLPGVNVLRRSGIDRLLIPDIAVVETEAAEREDEFASLSMRPEDIYLAVEVISPSSRKSDLNQKKQFYAEWKIGSYWVLDPRLREIHEFGWRVSADCWLADVDVSGIWSR